jgi:hypothetical protein
MVVVPALAVTNWAVAHDGTSSGDAGATTGGYEYGVQFTSKVPGFVEGVYFYAGGTTSGDPIASLWSAEGVLVARAEHSRVDRGGWHRADFRTPIKVDPGVSYVVSFWSAQKRPTTNPNSLQLASSGIISGKEIAVDASLLRKGRGFPDHHVEARRELVVPVLRHVNIRSDPVARPEDPTAQATATGSPTESASSTPSPTSTGSPTNSGTPSSSPPPPPPSRSGFPDASNTGVPSGTVLSAYTGPCTITTPNTVIDAKTVSCGLQIRASGVKITRSKLGDGITVLSGSEGAVSVTDSEIIASPNSTSVGDVNFTVERSNIWGGNRGVYCYDNCTVRDSYIHGIRYTGDTHASGMRAGQRTTYEHNTIWCDAPNNSQDGGCSADLTMYGDFTTVQYVMIRNNLFKATPGGFCGYGGSSEGKPYPNAHHIVFDGNVFERGSGGKCGYWGAVTDFSSSSTGNQWTNNVWDDGAVAKPSS